MKIIGHRGNHQAAPENSWQAFESAVQLGCDRIELDVLMSKDKVLYINHDDHLERTTSTLGYISKMDSRDIKKVKLKNGESLPRLDHVIEHFAPKIELNIEIKGNNISLTQQALALAERTRWKDSLIFSCFYLNPLVYLKQHSKVQKAVLWGQDTITIHPFGYMFPKSMLKKAGTHIIHPQVDMVNRKLMKQAKENHWTVYAWSPMKEREGHSNPDFWDNLQKLGVHGLCTNYPEDMLQWKKNQI